MKINLAKIRSELDDNTADYSNSPQIAEYNQPLIQPRPRRRWRWFLLVLAIIVVGWLIINHQSEPTVPTAMPSFWGQLKRLITSGDRELKGETENRINILLLGMGGLGHDGPYLTDTIILASFDPKQKKIALLSIPRDLVMPIPGYGWRKINNANAYGELENPGHGAELSVKTISTVLSIPIHYYVRIDFAGFKEFIDDLGGVEVCVGNAFTDTQFPDENYGTQTISFNTGCQHMDGQRVLEYTRSRHGNNNEGSDFARSRRQQEVLMAAKSELFSASTLLNPITLTRLYSQYTDHIATSLEMWEMIRLAQLSRGLNKENITSQTLTNEPGGLLEDVIGDDGAFLLQPPGGNYNDIRKLVATMLDTNAIPTAEVTTNPTLVIPDVPAASADIQAEKATIEIRNGTFSVGLAGAVQQRLIAMKLLVPTVGNAPFRDFERTVIYDLSNGTATKTTAFLAEKLQGTVTTDAPGWVKNIATATVFVVLGASASSLGW